MSKQIGISPAATAYAQAILELAESSGSLEELGPELFQFAGVVEKDATLRAFLSDPGIRPEERWRVLELALANNASPLFTNTLGVLNQKGRLGLLPQIAEAYKRLLDQKQNRVQVEVTVARELEPEQLEQVRQRVGSALSKNVIIQQKIDDSIIGGLVLRVGDQVIDGSVNAQLQAMRKQLLAARA